MYDERFARQYRYEPPSEFPLSLPFTGIVHHLSGPNRYAHTQTSLNWLVGCWCKNPSSHFHYASRFNTRELAHMLDSLVRVSRRVRWNHLVTKQSANEFQQTRSPTRRQATMSLKFSPVANWRWHTRQEAPRMSCSRLTTTLTLKQQAITLTRSNLAKLRWFHSLPFQQFQALLTLFSKSFSPFPHGTCLLSVSKLYLALDETYHPICAPIPRNVTRGKNAVHGGLQMTNRTLTLNGSLFQAAYICAPVSNTSWDYNSKPEATISMLSLSLFIRHYWGNPI